MNRLSQTLLEQLHSEATACLNAILRELAFGIPSTADWELARAALDALPQSTEEAGITHNRLQNARAYCDAGEPGAARYELRLLTGTLENT